MATVLPPRMTPAAFDRALAAFAGVVGKDFVLASDDDRNAYSDLYAFTGGKAHPPAGAVGPGSAEEVEAIVRVANEHKVPLWPISRGKNFGYGGAAPVLGGSVVLDLGRLNRILELDVKQAYAVLEPGVGFYDLYDHLLAEKAPLWMSMPGNAWGSVVGNALERGLGYTPYGDHATKLCGMEVILPTGGRVRTGMGAMAGSKAWQAYQPGFGPSWDQTFMQGNLGVVVKAGVWLMPEPEATMRASVQLDAFDDLAWAIDELAPLRLRGVIEHPFIIGSFLRNAATTTVRKDWYDGPGSLADSAARKIIDHYKCGWWGFSLALYGYPEMLAANAKLISSRLEPHLGRRVEWTTWRRGEPYEQSGRPAPSVLPLAVVNWRGGRGGHIGFSPVMPPDGRLALEHAKQMKARFDAFGLDYYSSFTMGHRHINNVNMIIYDRDDRAMTAATDGLFKQLIADNKARGYGEYRTHLSYMDAVAESYDWGGHALRKLNERVKDALDPNGIIAPGKNGIWPKAYR